MQWSLAAGPSSTHLPDSLKYQPTNQDPMAYINHQFDFHLISILTNFLKMTAGRAGG